MSYLSQAKLSLIEKIAVSVGDAAQKEFPKHIYEQALLKADKIIAKKYHVCQKYIEIANLEGREVAKDISNFQSDFRFLVGDIEYKRVNVLSGSPYEYALIETSTGVKFDYFPKNSTVISGPAGQFTEDSTLSVLATDILYDGTDYEGWYIKVGNEERKVISHSKTTGETISFTVDPFILLPADNTVTLSKWTGEDIITLCYNSIPDDEDYDQVIIPSKYEEEQITYAILHLCKIGVAMYSDEVRQKKYGTLYKIYSKDEKSLDSDLVKNNSWIVMQPNVWL